MSYLYHILVIALSYRIIRCFACVYINVIFLLNLLSKLWKSFLHPSSWTGGWLEAQAVSPYLCHISVTLLSYFCYILLLYLCHTPVVFLSYSCRMSVIYMSYLYHILVIALSYRIIRCFACVYINVIFLLNLLSKLWKSSLHPSSWTGGWLEAEAVSPYLCHISVTLLSYFCHTPVVFLSYSCRISVILLSYVCHTPVIVLSYICHISTIFLSLLCHIEY